MILRFYSFFCHLFNPLIPLKLGLPSDWCLEVMGEKAEEKVEEEEGKKADRKKEMKAEAGS